MSKIFQTSYLLKRLSLLPKLHFSQKRTLSTKPISLYKDGPKEIFATTSLDREAMLLLQHATFGDTFGYMYRNLNIPIFAEVIKQFNPYVVIMTEEGDYTGVCVLLKRQIETGFGTVDAIVRPTFAIGLPDQGRGMSSILNQVSTEFAFSLLPKDNPGVLYNFVEALNVRAMNVSKKSMKYEGSYYSVWFHRLSPKLDPSVVPLEESDHQQLKTLLLKQNQGYKCFNFEEDLDFENYYVIKKGDEIVCGLQVDPHCRKKICNIPEKSKMVLGPLLVASSAIPFANRYINVNSFTPLKFYVPFCKPGYELKLVDLMSHLLKVHGRHSALIGLDTESNILKTWEKEKIKFGYFSLGGKQLVNHMFAVTRNFTPEQEEIFRNAPVFVSPIENYMLL